MLGGSSEHRPKPSQNLRKMRFWGALEAFLDALGALLGRFWGILESSETQDTPKRRPKGAQEASKRHPRAPKRRPRGA